MAALSEENDAKLSWYKRTYESRRKAIELNNGFDMKFLGYCHGFAGDDADNIAELMSKTSDKVGYLTEAHRHRILAERYIKELDQRHAKTCLWQANASAKILGQIHPDIRQRRAWQNVFTDGIRRFRQEYLQNSN